MRAGRSRDAAPVAPRRARRRGRGTGHRRLAPQWRVGRAPRRDRRTEPSPVGARRSPRDVRDAAEPAPRGPARRDARPGRARRRRGVGAAPERAAHGHEGGSRRRHEHPQRQGGRGGRGPPVHRRRQRRTRRAPAPRLGGDRLGAAVRRRALPSRAGIPGWHDTPLRVRLPGPVRARCRYHQWAFATNASGGNIQVLHRQADGSWTTAGDALGQFPAWATAGKTWAPSVLQRLGGFVLFYTVREAATGRQCVSRATSTAPGGPYVDTSAGPLACGDREALDPEPVVGADGTPVLMWKRERPAAIVAQPLTPDGLALAGTERELLRANQRWEDSNVEAPSMLVSGNGSWLFFSGGFWSGSKYATGVVHCAGPLGPCDRAGPAPLLASHDRIAGPGGASVFPQSPGTFGLAYHAYVSPNVGYPASRLFFVGSIDLRTGRPVIVG